MEVELIFKVAAVGILVAVLNILLTRSGREEQFRCKAVTVCHFHIPSSVRPVTGN